MLETIFIFKARNLSRFLDGRENAKQFRWSFELYYTQYYILRVFIKYIYFVNIENYLKINEYKL